MAKVSLHSRRKLKARDAELFVNAEPPLFAQLAQAVCRAGVIAQKELHECWQMARLVDEAFSETLHIADLAAGHGLLGWVLVLLARTRKIPLARTAVAVDIQRPQSAERLRAALTDRWPELAGSLHYVEGSLDAVRTRDGSGTLFVAAHACGRLSDRVLLAALSSVSPLAIMPCCHSLRKQGSTLTSLAEAANLPGTALSAMTSHAACVGQPAAIDEFRIQALRSLGYRIDEAFIQPEITRYNRIVLGTPSQVLPTRTTETFPAASPVKRQGHMRAYEHLLSLDVADIKEAQMLSRRPPRECYRSFDLSFWVNDPAAGQHLAEVLSTLARGQAAEAKTVITDQYFHPGTQRLAFTYRIELKSSTSIITRAEVLSLRTQLCQALAQQSFELRGG